MEGDSDGRLADGGLLDSLEEEEASRGAHDRSRTKREPRMEEKKAELPDLRGLLANAKSGDVEKNQLNKNLLNLLKNQVKVTENFSTAMKDKLGRKDTKINEMEAEMEELRHKLRKLEKGSQDDHRKSRKKNELEDELSRTKRKLERERSRVANRLEPIAETFEHEDSSWCRWSYFLWTFILLLNVILLSAVFFPNVSRFLSNEASSLLKYTDQSGIFLSQAQTRIDGLETQLSMTRKAEKDCLEGWKSSNESYASNFANECRAVCDSRGCQSKLMQCQTDLDNMTKFQQQCFVESDQRTAMQTPSNETEATTLLECQHALQSCAEKLPQEIENSVSNVDSLDRCTRVLHGAQRSFTDCKKQSSELEKEADNLRLKTDELNQSLLICRQNLTDVTSLLPPGSDVNQSDGLGVCFNHSESFEQSVCGGKNQAGAQKMTEGLNDLQAKLEDIMQFDAGVIDALMNQAATSRTQLESALAFAQANSSELANCSSRARGYEEELDSCFSKLRGADKEVLKLDQTIEGLEIDLKECGVDLNDSRITLENLEAKSERERVKSQEELEAKAIQIKKSLEHVKNMERAQKALEIGYLDCEHSVNGLTKQITNLTLQSKSLERKQKECVDEGVKEKLVLKNLEQQLHNYSSELEVCRLKKVEPAHDSDTCAARLDSVRRTVEKITSLESGVRKSYLEMLQNKTAECDRYIADIALLQQEKDDNTLLRSALQTCQHEKQHLKEQTVDLRQQTTEQDNLTNSLIICEQEKLTLTRSNENIALSKANCELDRQALSEASDTCTTLRLSLQACETERQNLHHTDQLKALQTSLEACQRGVDDVSQNDNSELQISLQNCNAEKQQLLHMNHDQVPASTSCLEDAQEQIDLCTNRQKQLERETQVIAEQKNLLEKRNLLLESEIQALLEQNIVLNESLAHIKCPVVNDQSVTIRDTDVTKLTLDSEAKRNAGALLAVWLALSDRQDSRTFENELSNGDHQIRSLLTLKTDVQTLLKNDLIGQEVVELGQKVLTVLPGLMQRTEPRGAKVEIRDVLKVDFRDLLANVSLPSYDTVTGLRTFAQNFSIQEWDAAAKGLWLFMVVSLDVSLFQAFLPYSRFGIFLVFVLWAGLTVYCFVLQRKICMALFACNATLGLVFLLRPKLAMRFWRSKGAQG